MYNESPCIYDPARIILVQSTASVSWMPIIVRIDIRRFNVANAADHGTAVTLRTIQKYMSLMPAASDGW